MRRRKTVAVAAVFLLGNITLYSQIENSLFYCTIRNKRSMTYGIINLGLVYLTSKTTVLAHLNFNFISNFICISITFGEGFTYIIAFCYIL